MADLKPATIEALSRLKVIPVVSLPDAALAEPLGDALVQAGLGCVEVTFRTDAAEKAIRVLSRRGDLFVAAGTVLHREQAKRALDAGARCLLSPGTDPALIQWCIADRADIIPGVATPTDILLAMRLGLSTLKFFPAETMGGVAALKSIAGPFPDLRFVPTGGVCPDNLADYLALPNVLACGGSWMVREPLLAQRDFDSIQRLAAQAVSLIRASFNFT